MNVFTYLTRVVSLALFLPFLSISAKGQCGQPDGTIIVNSTADEGIGTLRDAINCANIFEGPNRIVFDIPTTNRAIIQVGSTSSEPLPSLINAATVIDGTTQAGFGLNGNFEPKIVLDGSGITWDAPINAIKIFGSNAEIYGLEIRNFPDDGIDVENAENVVIGDEEKGNVIYNCGIAQDFFPATGNIGPFNGVGIVVTGDSDNATITNNIIGTDYAGTPNLGNEWAGIYMRNGADFALIESNIITANEIGVRIRNAFAIKITENTMTCNTLTGIQLSTNGNDDKAPPTISSATSASITGTGRSGDEIEIYLAENCGSSPCQGGTFLGRAIVGSNGTWNLNAPYNANISNNASVTAVAIDNNDRTSPFSTCQTASVSSNCADANGIIWVSNANDEGAGSLRAAIDCANATPGPNTIQFNIDGGGRKQINVGSANGNELPFLRDAGTIIDGTTQPGFGSGGNLRPQIVLDGGSYDWRFPHNAIWVRADNCEIYGLEVRNFPDDGIDITGGDNIIIGAPGKGNVIYNCGLEKDVFEDDPNQRIYNGCGIVLKNGVQNSIIQSNIIGTDYSQTETIGNELCGIILQRNGSNNLIGGTNPDEGNIIAYNEFGITVLGGAYNNQILGNSFYCNEINGIELSSDGNNAQAAPSINIASVSVINGTGTNGETIEVYTINSNCQDGPCQGNTLIGRATVSNSTWRLDAPFLNGIQLQGGDQITALATSPNGSTSEFGACTSLGGVTPPSECSLNLGISNFNNETCAGSDGTFTLTATNATQPVTYDYGNGATQMPTFSNLIAGSYSVTATDALGCTAGLNVTISQDPTPSLSLVSTNNENCGAADGSFNVQAAGGQAPYIYELNDGTISRLPNFSNLAAGSYTVSVIDANNCIATQTVDIQQTGSINVAIADMRDDACNTASGSFRIAASGGQAPYTYDLGNGALTSNQFSGLSAGNYVVTVSDANNCSTIAMVDIDGGVAPIASISSVTQASCAQPTGSVSIAVAGGRAPFQFNIGNGNTPQPTFSDLAAGDYVVTVTDVNNCTTTQSITIDEPSSPSLSLVSTQNAACGNANGQATVLSAGGQGPYTYDIGQGRTGDPNFSSLAEGNYTVTVIDANNCTDEIAVSIGNSPIPTLAIGSMQSASCNLNNAIITVEGTGAAPLTYDIGNGPTSDPTFSNLAAGSYTVTLTDNNNCVASATVEIESSAGPQINVQSTSEARCDRENGSIVVNAFGGFAPYTYDIGNGPSDSPEFYDLAGGNYEVTLTDANGCASTQAITLGNIPAPTFGIGNITDASCGEPNGSFNVSAFGGTAPYQFDIGGAKTDDPFFSNLNEGAYTVVVTDANECSSVLRVTVEGTEMPEVAVTNELTANCGVADGGFDLEVTGGVGPYFFDFGAGESTNSSFRNLAVGNYDITITDASSCSQIKTIEVKGSADINLSVTDELPAACGGTNGQFTLNATGGQAPYSYTLNGTQTDNPTFDNLAAGTYEVQTTDANGCSTTETIEVPQSDGPEVEIEVSARCGDESALVSITATQGQAPYTYDIGEGPSQSDIFRSVTPGLYQVKVTDAVGCESTKSLVVNISDQEPAANIDILSEPSCNAQNGSIKINVTKGTPPYIYAMSETDLSPFATFSNLGTGDYQITVTDAGGCSTMVPVSLGGNGSEPVARFNLNFDEFDGTFTNTTQNGTAYTWDFGDGTTANSDNANHSYATDGTYTICLTATNDCGTDTHCENYTIQAQNTNRNVEFDLGEISGSIGETVKIPVYVLNFNDAVGFQKSVVIEDPTVAKIVGITDVNLKDLAAGLFNIREQDYTVSWFDGSIEGVDVPDSTIIYQIEVELLTDDACTGILIADNPLETQVYKKDGNSEIEVEYFSRVGKICVGEGANSNQSANISGLIMTEEGMNVSNVNISCTNTADLTNQLDGTYLFEALPTPFQYNITPTKNINPINGVTTFDLVTMQNHILGNQQLDSPYKMIAADVNKTGTITVADILELKKLLLLEATVFSNNESWRFIPMDYEFSNPNNPFSEDFPESASINLSTNNEVADFIAIKVGDVNNTATPNSLVNAESRNATDGTFLLSTTNVYLQKGETATITFSNKNIGQLAGLQYTLASNQQAISIEKVVTNQVFEANSFGKSLLNRGFLLTSWTNPNLDNKATASALFSIKIKANQAGKVSDLLTISDNFLQAEAYHSDGRTLAVQLAFIEQNPKLSDNFSLSQNQPNPFSENTVINYQLPKAGMVEFAIFDIQGSLLKATKEQGNKGWNEVQISKRDLPTGGVYYYQIKTPFGQATKKMILID